MTTLVPKLDLSMAQQVLNSRLQAAEAFQEAYGNLRAQDAASMNTRLFANLALEKSIDSDHTYSFMTTTTENRLAGSRAAFNKAQLEFRMLQLDLKNKQDDFKAGIEAWKVDKTKKILGSVFTAIAAVVGGIALACAAPPAAAAGIAAGVGEIESAVQAANTAKEAIGLWQDIHEIVDIIKALYEKIEPYLEKIKELVEAIGQITDLIQSKTSMDDFNKEEIEGITLPGMLPMSYTLEAHCVETKKQLQQSKATTVSILQPIGISSS